MVMEPMWSSATCWSSRMTKSSSSSHRPRASCAPRNAHLSRDATPSTAAGGTSCSQERAAHTRARRRAAGRASAGEMHRPIVALLVAHGALVDARDLARGRGDALGLDARLGAAQVVERQRVVEGEVALGHGVLRGRGRRDDRVAVPCAARAARSGGRSRRARCEESDAHTQREAMGCVARACGARDAVCADEGGRAGAVRKRVGRRAQKAAWREGGAVRDAPLSVITATDWTLSAMNLPQLTGPDAPTHCESSSCMVFTAPNSQYV